MPRRTNIDKSQARKRSVPKVRRYAKVKRAPRKPFVAEPVKAQPLMTAASVPTLWPE